MKIRNGYVSNSSSSSYVIAVGIVKKEFIEEVRQIVEKEYDLEESGFCNNDQECSVEAFDGARVTVEAKFGDYVLKLHGTGSEPPSNECGEYNYDAVDETFFDDWIWKLLKEEKFEKLEYLIGAGYNG